MDKGSHASSPQTGHFTDWGVQPARRTAKSWFVGHSDRAGFAGASLGTRSRLRTPGRRLTPQLVLVSLTGSVLPPKTRGAASSSRYFHQWPRNSSLFFIASSVNERPRQPTNEGGSHRFRRRREDCFCRQFFGGDIAVDLVSIGVIVGQSRLNLCERKVLDLGGDLLGSQPQIVPPGNTPNRDTCTRDARTAFSDVRRSLDQRPNIDDD